MHKCLASREWCGSLLSAHCMTNTVLKYSQLELGGIVVLQLSMTEKALHAELGLGFSPVM